MFRMARITAHPQEPVLKAPALEVVLELLLDIPRQFAALLRQMGLERGVVFLDKLVKESTFRAVALVASRPDTRTGFPASRQRQHDRILAKFSCTSD
jgi:hypothetical protein